MIFAREKISMTIFEFLISAAQNVNRLLQIGKIYFF